MLLINIDADMQTICLSEYLLKWSQVYVDAFFTNPLSSRISKCPLPSSFISDGGTNFISFHQGFTFGGNPSTRIEYTKQISQSFKPGLYIDSPFHRLEGLVCDCTIKNEGFAFS